MSQMLHFQFESDPGTQRVGDLGNKNLGKPLEWRDQDET